VTDLIARWQPAAVENSPAATLVARCVVQFFPHSFSQSSSDGPVDVFRPASQPVSGKGSALNTARANRQGVAAYEIFAITGSILKYHCAQSFYGRRHPIHPERTDRPG
jgi:hypothetical protein